MSAPLLAGPGFGSAWAAARAATADGDRWLAHLVSFGDRPCLTDRQGTTWNALSGVEVARRVDQLARYLRDGLLSAGRRVVVLSESSAAAVITGFATVRAGGTVVPLDASLGADRLASLVDASAAVVVAVSRRHLALGRELLSRCDSLVEVLLLDEEPVGGKRRYVDLVAQRPVELPPVCDEQVAVITFTSGTEGTARAVKTTVGALRFEVAAVSGLMRLEGDERALSILPLHHLFEITVGLLSGLAEGAEIVFETSLLPDDIGRALHERRITRLAGVPALFSLLRRGILDRARRRGALASLLLRVLLAVSPWFPLAARRVLFGSVHARLGGHLRALASGGAPLPAQVDAFFWALGLPLFSGYGLTETGPVIATNAPGAHRPGTVGKPLAGVEVRIDATTREILTRGPHVTAGYLGERAGSHVDAEGWFHTGDLGSFSSDGFLSITGRAKDLIVLPSGKKVHPDEVETAFVDVSAALEVAAVGVDGPRGEEVWLVATPKPDVDTASLREELARAAERLARWQRPSRTVVRRAPLPRTPTRKVQRSVLRSELVAGRTRRPS